MAGDSKPSIPAWQRAQQPLKAETNTSPEAKEPPKATEDEASMDSLEEEESAPPSEGASQLDMVDKFLSDPSIQEAPLEKKRAFLESKSIPVETIDKVLPPEALSKKPNDFLQSFKEQQQRQQDQAKTVLAPQSYQQPAPSGPPIITYPEFLVEAHKPSPLVTPSRMIAAAYVASGAAALIYGASQYLVSPMRDQLTEARHDFATHTQSKVTEFNERLSKIVTKIPEKKTAEHDEDDNDSITSDPTELFHRDFGTQTSTPPSETSSEADIPKRDNIAHTVDGLAIITSHLNELLGQQKSAEPLDESRKLRHYLDTMMYSTPGSAYSLWSNGDDGSSAATEKKKDVVEELKKEIRGVKGVLLSARRFPAAAANVGVGRVGS